MATIYSAPKSIAIPSFNYIGKNFRKNYEKAEEKYLADLKKYILDSGYSGKNVGEVVRFPAADGYAQYMVVSMTPLRLMHLELIDGWHYPHAKNLKPTDIQAQLDYQNLCNK